MWLERVSRNFEILHSDEWDIEEQRKEQRMNLEWLENKLDEIIEATQYLMDDFSDLNLRLLRQLGLQAIFSQTIDYLKGRITDYISKRAVIRLNEKVVCGVRAENMKMTDVELLFNMVKLVKARVNRRKRSLQK